MKSRYFFRPWFSVPVIAFKMFLVDTSSSPAVTASIRALVGFVSRASPVFSCFCCLLFREVVSVDNQRSFVSLRYSPRNLTHNI